VIKTFNQDYFCDWGLGIYGKLGEIIRSFYCW